jgi:hypothetical protein
MFENRMLRIFGLRKLHNEELRDSYCLPSIIRIIKSRRMRRAGHVARMGEKRPLGRPRRRWVDNIKMDLGELGWGWCGLDWSGSGQRPVESSCECGVELSGSIKCWEVLEWLNK